MSAEDVFYLVEEGGAALRGLIVDVERGAKLLDELALLARELGRRQHTHVIIQIAFAAAVRVSQTLAAKAKDRAALRTFRDFQFFLGAEPRNLQLRAKRGLRHADGNGAVQIGAAAFEERMFLHLEDDIQIAAGTPVRSSFALALHAQARSSVDARGNAQLDGFFALHAALAAALCAALLDDLTRALASGARAGNGEESLLIGELAAATAGLASHD